MVPALTSNMQAYETYLQGVYYSNQFGDDAAMSKAIPYFREAISLAPDLGQAYAKLALCTFFDAFSGKSSWESAQDEMQRCMEKVSKLETPEVYFLKGLFEFFQNWNWAACLKIINEGIWKFPSHPPLYHMKSSLYWVSGDDKAIIECMNQGLALDPLSIEMTLYTGIGYLWQGDFPAAEALLDRILDRLPEHRAALEYMGWIAAFVEDYDKALSYFERLAPIGYRLHQATCLGWVHWKKGEHVEAEAKLDEILTLSEMSIIHSMDVAVLATCMGNFDLAFEHQEKLIRNRVGDSMMIRSDIFLKELQTDPRWELLLELIGEIPKELQRVG